MRHPIISLGCAFSLILVLSACKKAETPAPPAPPADNSATAPAGQTPATASPADAKAGAVLLKMKWPVGSRYTYRMDLDQHSTNNIPQMPQPMRQSVTMAMTYALTVLSETPDGGRELEMEFLANEMEVKMAEQVLISFDSKEAAKNDAPNPFTTPFRKMIGSKIRLQTGPQGTVEKVVAMEEWLTALAGEGPGPAREMVAQQFSEDYFRQIADFGRGLPAKAVTVGDTWPYKMDIAAGALGVLSMNATVILKGFEDRDNHHCAVLDSIGTFKGTPGKSGPMGKMTVEKGKLNATTWFDAELGAMIESSVNQALLLKGEMPGNQAPNAPPFTSDVSQTVTLKLVELTQAAK